MTRYDRQMRLPEIGAAGQARLARARVCVIGAGGLAATLLPLLAGAGVGQIRVIDPDRVEAHNLHRQTLFRMADIGRPKALVAVTTLADLNPDCRLTPVVAALGARAARDEAAWADVVLDAADNFAVTYALSDACLAGNTPLIAASVQGRAGHVGGFCGPAPSYRALFPDLPERLQSCASGGVMGPAVASLAALQAQMCLSVLLGHAPSPLGQLLTLDLAEWRPGGFRFDGAPEPAPMPAILDAEDIRPEDRIIELRSAQESPDLPHPRAERLDTAAIGTLAAAPGGRLVFACATGVRAWRAARSAAADGAQTAILLTPPKGVS
ncbi:hypothetical protein PSAL_016750 [Pseudooceanicola algae]|uniref:THIF-type NAD/FAD binding fold domain-containing protein n=2 Tax=Pseudooceanicola algae TaxID=1537215 RepID=A0A418SHB4_9RHOB|nr:hypothetical protein PSAL_016750 [Pseudooceanicola algae]